MRSTWTLLVILTLGGCGGPDHAIVDAPPHSDGGIDTVSVDSPAAQRHGLVQLSETSFSNTVQSSSSVVFADGDPLGTPIATDGPCATYPMGGSTGRNSAGTIDVTGTTQPITFTPNGTAPAVTYSHTPSPLPTDVFAAAATIHVSGAGAPGFAAFAGDVTAPTTMAFTAPATLSRAGATISWTAGAGTVVQIALVAGTTLILCRVPDTGSFAVPATTFALIPIATTSAIVAVARTMETVVTTASGPVALQALSATGGTVTIVTPP